MDQYHDYKTLAVTVGPDNGGDGCPSYAARTVYGPNGPNLDQIDQGFKAALAAAKPETSPPH